MATNILFLFFTQFLIFLGYPELIGILQSWNTLTMMLYKENVQKPKPFEVCVNVPKVKRENVLHMNKDAKKTRLFHGVYPTLQIGTIIGLDFMAVWPLMGSFRPP